MTPEELLVQLKQSDDPLAQEASVQIEQLLGLLDPFRFFAKNTDDHGWTSNIHRESISTWFGPSDFNNITRVCGEKSYD